MILNNYLLVTLFFLLDCLTCVYATNMRELNLSDYQNKSGAITVGYKDDFVDPYFAMRALLLANEEKMDIKKVAIPWINWLIHKQRADGRFDRYCKKDKKFVRCMPADADDVDMILWAQLLTLFANSPDMPTDWQNSYTKAMNYLENELYDKKLGIYNINKNEPVGLFMDNVEIAHAYFQLAKLKRLQGSLIEATEFELRGLILVTSIEQVFGKGSYHEVSTQPNQTQGFYPGAIAQIYPWIFSLPWKQNHLVNFTTWYEDWNVSIELPQADAAWGLVAIAAKHAGNKTFVNQWLNNAKTLRKHSKWNVLEEVIYQILDDDKSKHAI